ncbi:3-beta hydroxysteroid dehydrogenase/isomerase domain protein [Leptospira alexanderi serovar Manhao 3 str. L 60]|uniref:3-beta hydroxysteroid dehydrogenase/isomerase domain protein n=1 Tax=Leptospira alexanderi serovar Manhao 3 str. L 60 TaxID=1049759 RepID=V6HV84_9LEPT|nr:3-beta hydroxysteroid dehydrogenase/isomerase domain protein [Leptospira alexanderi serovar Manhao 3 str. L 60]
MILVTGADGFIGSHLVEALVKNGKKVRAFVLYNSFNSWGWLDQCSEDIKGKFEVFSGDIRMGRIKVSSKMNSNALILYKY